MIGCPPIWPTPQAISTRHPFTPLYVTDDEFALEIANQTVHGVMHVGWVPDGTGGHRGQMAVLVRPNGVLGVGLPGGDRAVPPPCGVSADDARHRTRMAAIGCGSTPVTAEVRQVDLPSSARALSTLARVDYCDAFLFDVGATHDESAEDLIREILEGAPLAVRTQLLSGWSAIGLKVGNTSERSVLGWEVRRTVPDHVLLGAESRIGMPGELLLKKEDDALLFATFVAQRNLVARAVWAITEPVHVRVVRDILVRRAGGSGGTAREAARRGAGGSGASGGSGAASVALRVWRGIPGGGTHRHSSGAVSEAAGRPCRSPPVSAYACQMSRRYARCRGAGPRRGGVSVVRAAGSRGSTGEARRGRRCRIASGGAGRCRPAGPGAAGVGIAGSAGAAGARRPAAGRGRRSRMHGGAAGARWRRRGRARAVRRRPACGCRPACSRRGAAGQAAGRVGTGSRARRCGDRASRCRLRGSAIAGGARKVNAATTPSAADSASAPVASISIVTDAPFPLPRLSRCYWVLQSGWQNCYTCGCCDEAVNQNSAPRNTFHFGVSCNPPHQRPNCGVAMRVGALDNVI